VRVTGYTGVPAAGGGKDYTGLKKGQLMNISSCGIDCDACNFKTEKNCPGCHALKGNPFWGSCGLYSCAATKTLPHCGKCDAFPSCKQWADALTNEGGAEGYAQALQNLQGLA
jgi:hypothetical protein